MQKIIPIGNCLIVLIGPSGAGKSTFCAKHFLPQEVISSDALREEILGDIQRQDKLQVIFSEFEHRIRMRLRNGLRAVADATHCHDGERKRTAFLGVEMGVPVYYVVINRSLAAKINHGGWRNSIRKGDRSLIEDMEITFAANESKILSGDAGALDEIGTPLATSVIDTRADSFTVAKPLHREGALALEEIRARGFEKVRVLGDVHGNLAGWNAAMPTETQRIFTLSLGDVVDYGVDTLVTASAAARRINLGIGAGIRGNHEKKIAKFVGHEIYGLGTAANVRGGNTITANRFKALPKDEQLKWAADFWSLVDWSPDWQQLGPNHLFVHAAALPAMWDNPLFRAIPESTLESFAMFGETDGSKIEGGFPARYYNWVDLIPHGKTVVVGHAVREWDKPLIQRSTLGGQAIFLDTGSSKTSYDETKTGFLSWADFDIREMKKVGLVLTGPIFGREG